MSQEVQRDLGRFEAQISAIGAKLDKVETEVESIGKTLAEARGGWRMLMMVSGASATIGGLIVKYLPLFQAPLPK